MIKNVKWFFVVLVFSSVISLAFSKENVHAMRCPDKTMPHWRIWLAKQAK